MRVNSGLSRSCFARNLLELLGEQILGNCFVDWGALVLDKVAQSCAGIRTCDRTVNGVGVHIGEREQVLNPIHRVSSQVGQIFD